MAKQGNPAWIGAATAGADRLAAEAVSDVDDLLAHADASPDRLADQIVRLEQSADPGEVAADLAGLLWADCEDVPPIATILEEPAAQAALKAVGDARRLAARRLSAVTAEATASSLAGRAGARDAAEPSEEHHAPAAPVPAPGQVPQPSAPAERLRLLVPATPRVAQPTPAAAVPCSAQSTPAVAAPLTAHSTPAAAAAAVPPLGAPPFTPAPAGEGQPVLAPPPVASSTSRSPGRRPAAGAVVAGAAAAILLFGRRIRRA